MKKRRCVEEEKGKGRGSADTAEMGRGRGSRRWTRKLPKAREWNPAALWASDRVCLVVFLRNGSRQRGCTYTDTYNFQFPSEVKNWKVESLKNHAHCLNMARLLTFFFFFFPSKYGKFWNFFFPNNPLWQRIFVWSPWCEILPPKK